MGFLDRMVADLIADSTGLPIRGLVRRVGVGRLRVALGVSPERVATLETELVAACRAAPDDTAGGR